MKNTFKILSIATFVAAVGFLFASCDSNGNSSTGGGSGSKEVLATINTYDSNGNLTWYTEHEYGSNGRLTKRSSYGADGVLNYYQVNDEYDAKGREKKISSYGANGVLNVYIMLEYDANGRPAKSSNYSANGVLSDYSVYIYRSL